ncbi:MAG: transcriptional regulator [Anaerolineae bacterium]|nr:transcriptional regulator [Anaerolineae bacterium]
MPNQEVVELRNRILGVLVRNARDRARVSREECAAALGVTENRFTAYEEGRRPISLPELELLARFLEVPLATFRSVDAVNEMMAEDALPDPDIFLPLRHRIIGARLRQMRIDANRTQQELADILECASSTISDYEYGKRSIPVAELEILAQALEVPLEDFMDHQSGVGEWQRLHGEFERFVKLPADVRDFVLRPINMSYLELAMRLSTMPAGALRAIAEGILEITY